jgi:hypothetical protein
MPPSRHCFTSWQDARSCDSHDELQAALRVAGKEIRKLNFGRSDTSVLRLLRRVLLQARKVAAAARAENPR